MKHPVQLRDSTREDAVKFRDYLIINLKNFARTANNTMMHLTAVYSHLQSLAKVSDNSFKIGKLKQQATGKNIAITDKDRAIIEGYLKEHEPEVYLFIRFVYYGFIRPGKLLEIRMEDVNLSQRFITVKGVVSKNGKTETAPIITPLYDCIHSAALIDPAKPKYRLFGSGLVPGLQVSGKQVLFCRHEKASKALGLDHKGYTLYSWKHTGAVNAYLSGMGLKELQAFLRHSFIQMTDIYLKSLGMRTDPKLNSYHW